MVWGWWGVWGVLEGRGAPGSSRAIGGRTLTGWETSTTSSCFPAKEQSVVKGREAASSPFAGQLLTRLPAAKATLKQSWLGKQERKKRGGGVVGVEYEKEPVTICHRCVWNTQYNRASFTTEDLGAFDMCALLLPTHAAE